MSEAADQTTLSRAAFDRLQAELDELKTTRRREVAERLQRARELGDLSENAEYHSAKDDQGLMEARVRQLEHLLKTATVVDEPVSGNEAVAGTVVALKEDGTDEVERYLLASSKEERANTVRTVTVNSPLGKAIHGKKVGETVEYQAPGGVFAYEVVEISPWDGSL